MDPEIRERDRQIAFAILIALLFIALQVPVIWWMHDIMADEVNPFIDGRDASYRFRYSWPMVGGFLMAALFYVRSAKYWIRGVALPSLLAGAVIFLMVYASLLFAGLVIFLGLIYLLLMGVIFPSLWAIGTHKVVSKWDGAVPFSELSKLDRYLLCCVFIGAQWLHTFGWFVENDWYFTLP